MAEERVQDDLIDFMFLRHGDGQLDVMRCLNLWFGKSNETDAEIITRFSNFVELALAGKLNHWMNSPRGCLALMIVIDQFPRNIYRHTVRAFDGALASRKVVDIGFNWLEVLRPEECLFVPCLILTHQESVEHQRACVDFYNRLEPLLPTELHIFRTIFEEHLRIVEVCGHFPHRDHYYGRTTTNVGKSLMENSKVRFDLPLICENGRVRFGHNAKKLWRTTEIAFDIMERIDAIVDKTVQWRRNSVLAASLAPLSVQQMGEHKEIFGHFDQDGSGNLEVQELASVLASTGRRYDATRIQEAVDSITGRPGSETVTFEQFSTLLSIDMSSTLEERLEKRFRMFDSDGSGEISLPELVSCIRSLDGLITVEDIEWMMKESDIDGSGSISLEEFRAMVPVLASTSRRKSAVPEAPPSRGFEDPRKILVKPATPLFDPTYDLGGVEKVETV